ncbi:MAG: hypothetical protein H6Q67_671 [Firmicutes bacterium]|nr:hypothetical protein [Bacillota bacterium]
MSVYNKAHELARELKESAEYKKLVEIKAVVDTDDEAKKMVKDFLVKKAELEYEALTGKGEDKTKLAQLQQMAGLLSHNTKARECIEAYTRFHIIMSDVSKIIGDSVAEGMDIFAKG